MDPAPEGSSCLGRRVHPLSQSLNNKTGNAHEGNGQSSGGISSVAQSTFDSLIATERGLLGFAQTFFNDSKQEGAKGLWDVLPELLVSVERLPFNKPCGEGRKFCWVGFDMAEVQAVRQAVGGRVNDVILTVLTRRAHLRCAVKVRTVIIQTADARPIVIISN